MKTLDTSNRKSGNSVIRNQSSSRKNSVSAFKRPPEIPNNTVNKSLSHENIFKFKNNLRDNHLSITNNS